MRFLYPINIGDKWGYIDAGGVMQVEPLFEYASPFSEERAAVKLNGQYGFIDPDGALTIEPQFRAVFEFAEGMAPVLRNELWGFIDLNGQFAIEPAFAMVLPFSCNIAWAFDKTIQELARAASANLHEHPKAFAIDRKGNEIGFGRYLAAQQFTYDLAAVRDERGWFYIRPDGRPLDGTRFLHATPFAEQLAYVTRATGPGRGEFINTDGTHAFDSPGICRWPFQEGLATVSTSAGEEFKSGFVDRSGTFVIAPQFEQAFPFSEGMATVRLANRWGAIDRGGNLVLKPEYHMLNSFRGGLAYYEKETRQGYLNPNGNSVWEAERAE